MKTAKEIYDHLIWLLKTYDLLRDGVGVDLFIIKDRKISEMANALHAFMTEDEFVEWPPTDVKDEIEEKAAAFTNKALAPSYTAFFQKAFAHGVEAHMRHKEPGDLDRALKHYEEAQDADGLDGFGQEAIEFTRAKLKDAAGFMTDEYIQGFKEGVEIYIRHCPWLAKDEAEAPDHRSLPAQEPPEKLEGYYQLEVRECDLYKMSDKNGMLHALVHLTKREK